MQAPLTTHLQEAQQPMDAFVPPHAACCRDGSLTLCPGPWASEWGAQEAWQCVRTVLMYEYGSFPSFERPDCIPSFLSLL